MVENMYCRIEMLQMYLPDSFVMIIGTSCCIMDVRDAQNLQEKYGYLSWFILNRQ